MEIKLTYAQYDKVVSWMRSVETELDRDIHISESDRALYDMLNTIIKRNTLETKPFNPHDVMRTANIIDKGLRVTMLGTDMLGDEECVIVTDRLGITYPIEARKLERLDSPKRIAIPHYVPCDKPVQDSDASGNYYVAMVHLFNADSDEGDGFIKQVAKVKYVYNEEHNMEHFILAETYGTFNSTYTIGQNLPSCFVNVFGSTEVNW